ncbi:hypothetical protein [Streptomyces blastmyceticus]|uniref:hypothetical protein n=1 Tax=Streptomyces blastmyceticus TaxID=68180 RepID=UPI0031D42D70
MSGPVDPQRPCEFPGALLLPRRGAEQDWAVEMALAALDEHAIGERPACTDLITTADGIRIASQRPGLCSPELQELSRTALGASHGDWDRLFREDPAAFRAAAADGYVLHKQAAVLATRGPDGRLRRSQVVHARQEKVLRDYTAGLLRTAALATKPETEKPSPHTP